MSYTNVLDSVYAQATAVAGFSDANVSRNDLAILRSGQGSAIVINYDSFRQEIRDMAGDHVIHWRFLVGLYTRATGRDAAGLMADMATVRQNIINRFNQYPKLGGTANVFHSFLEEGAEADERLEIGNVSYAYEILRLVATEEVAVTYAE